MALACPWGSRPQHQKRTRRHFAASARNSSVSLPAAKECFRELLARRGVCLPALTTSMGGVPRTAALPVPLKQSGSNLRLGNQGNRNCAEGISPMPTQDREARMKLLVIAAALVISTSALAKNGGGGGGGGSGHSGPGMSMSHPGSGPGSGMNPLASVEGICAVEDGDISIVDGGGITELDP